MTVCVSEGTQGGRRQNYESSFIAAGAAGVAESAESISLKSIQTTSQMAEPIDKKSQMANASDRSLREDILRREGWEREYRVYSNSTQTMIFGEVREEFRIPTSPKQKSQMANASDRSLREKDQMSIEREYRVFSNSTQNEAVAWLE